MIVNVSWDAPTLYCLGPTLSPALPAQQSGYPAHMLQAITAKQWLWLLLLPHWLKLLQRLNELTGKDARPIPICLRTLFSPIVFVDPGLHLCPSLPERCLWHSPAHMSSTATMMIISPVCSCLSLSSPSMVMSPAEKRTQAGLAADTLLPEPTSGPATLKDLRRSSRGERPTSPEQG